MITDYKRMAKMVEKIGKVGSGKMNDMQSVIKCNIILLAYEKP